MNIDLRLPGALVLVATTNLYAAGAEFDTNIAAMSAEAAERNECVDKLSVSIAANWLGVLSGENIAKLQDPVVKRAAQAASRGDIDDSTKLAARRMLAYTATVRGSINQKAAEQGLTDLRREFKNLDIPALREALRTEGRGAEFTIMVGVRAIRPDRRMECWEAFRDYVVAQDARLALIPTEGRDTTPSPWLRALQQTQPGTDEPGQKYQVPGEQCGVPAHDFYKPLPSGRVSGTYDSLGFPEVVFLKYKSGKTCSGTLLSPVWVLTAGHCVMENGIPDDYATLKISINRDVANASGNKRSSAAVKKDRVFVLPEYLQLSLKDGKDNKEIPLEKKAQYDLALIELESALDVALQSTVWQRDPPGDFLAALAGFGVNRSNRPVSGDVTNKLDVGWLKASANVQTVQWMGYDPAAGDSTKDSVPCPGDSGSPIYLNAWKGSSASDAPVMRPSLPAVGCQDERRQVIGVVSFINAERDASSWDKRTCFQWIRGGGATLAQHLGWICKISGLYCKTK